jgi:hypothetical protein
VPEPQGFAPLPKLESIAPLSTHLKREGNSVLNEIQKSFVSSLFLACRLSEIAAHMLLRASLPSICASKDISADT